MRLHIKKGTIQEKVFGIVKANPGSCSLEIKKLAGEPNVMQPLIVLTKDRWLRRERVKRPPSRWVGIWIYFANAQTIS